MIFLNVSLNRFYYEWQKYVMEDMKHELEWYVDEAEILHAFVFADNGVAYHFYMPSKEAGRLPLDLLDSIRSRKGEFLGFHNPFPETEELPRVSIMDFPGMRNKA